MSKYEEIINAYESEATRLESLGQKDLAKTLRKEAEGLKASMNSKVSFDGYYHPKGMRQR